MVLPVGLGKIDIKLWIPISSGVLKIISIFIFTNTDPIFYNHSIIYFILLSLGRCLGLFFYLREPNINELCDDPDKIKEFKKIKYYNYPFFLLSSIFNFLELSLANFETINDGIEISLDLIFINLFSIFILKTKFYKHQYSVIIISIILTIFISILEFTDSYTSKEEYIKIGLTILSLIFRSLSIIIDKYIIENRSATVFEILFYNGLTTLILNAIYLTVCSIYEIPKENIFFEDQTLITYNKKRYYDNFFSYIESINEFEILNIFIDIIFEFFMQLTFLFTIKYFSPSYIILIFIIWKIPLLINEYIISNSFITYLNIISFCFLLFLNLVFIEIIELNFCGCGKNTKRNIQLRAQLDALEAEKKIYGDYKDELDNSLISENKVTIN